MASTAWVFPPDGMFPSPPLSDTSDEDSARFFCVGCGEEYQSQHDLDVHHNSSSHSFTCRFCKWTFPNHAVYQTHLSGTCHRRPPKTRKSHGSIDLDKTLSLDDYRSDLDGSPIHVRQLPGDLSSSPGTDTLISSPSHSLQSGRPTISDLTGKLDDLAISPRSVLFQRVDDQTAKKEEDVANVASTFVKYKLEELDTLGRPRFVSGILIDGTLYETSMSMKTLKLLSSIPYSASKTSNAANILAKYVTKGTQTEAVKTVSMEDKATQAQLQSSPDARIASEGTLTGFGVPPVSDMTDQGMQTATESLAVMISRGTQENLPSAQSIPRPQVPSRATFNFTPSLAPPQMSRGASIAEQIQRSDFSSRELSMQRTAVSTASHSSAATMPQPLSDRVKPASVAVSGAIPSQSLADRTPRPTLNRPHPSTQTTVATPSSSKGHRAPQPSLHGLGASINTTPAAPRAIEKSSQPQPIELIRAASASGSLSPVSRGTMGVSSAQANVRTVQPESTPQQSNAVSVSTARPPSHVNPQASAAPSASLTAESIHATLPSAGPGTRSSAETEVQSSAISSAECIACKRRFLNYEAFKQHIRSWPTHSLWYCEQCDRGFLQERGLQLHLQDSKVHNHGWYCDECDHEFATENQLTQHLRTASVHRQLWFCDTCDREFKDENGLTNHLQTSSLHQNWYCEECDREFGDERALTQHLETSSIHRRWFCKECDREFNDENGLTSHLRDSRRHKAPTVYCEKCNIEFGSQDALDMHVANSSSHLDRSQSVVCGVCRNWFKSVGAIDRHSRKHEGHFRGWGCGACRRGPFPSESALEQHVRDSQNHR